MRMNVGVSTDGPQQIHSDLTEDLTGERITSASLRLCVSLSPFPHTTQMLTRLQFLKFIPVVKFSRFARDVLIALLY